VRSFGVEEEFLLVDARTGNHAPVAENLLTGTRPKLGVPTPNNRSARSTRKTRTGSLNNHLATEVQREQLEAVSAPFTALSDLAAAIRAGRVEANR
jgi:carboxylate-amine ligase